MKPIFAVDITEDKDNEQMPAENFVGAVVRPETADELDRLSEKTDDIIESAKPPILSRIALGFSGIVCLLSFVFFVAGIEEAGFRAAFEKFSIILVLFVITLAVTIVLAVFNYKRVKEVLTSAETDRVTNTFDAVLARAYEELGVPEDAKEVDILCFWYKWKNGEPVFKAPNIAATSYVNMVKKIYARDGMLFMADSESRYDFKISDMHAIRTVKKRIPLFDWNKDEDYNKGEYKKYRITKDDKEVYYVKPYHILEMTVDGEEMGIYFPPYELPVFEELTGLRAAEE